MSYLADKQVLTAHTDGRTDTQTDAGNSNTQRPKLASGKNVSYHTRLNTVVVETFGQLILFRWYLPHIMT